MQWHKLSPCSRVPIHVMLARNNADPWFSSHRPSLPGLVLSNRFCCKVFFTVPAVVRPFFLQPSLSLVSRLRRSLSTGALVSEDVDASASSIQFTDYDLDETQIGGTVSFLPPIDMQFASRLHLGACNCAHKHSSVAEVSSKTFVVVSCALPARSSGVGYNNSSRLYGPRWRLCRSSWPMGVLAYLGLLAAMFCRWEECAICLA